MASSVAAVVVVIKTPKPPTLETVEENKTKLCRIESN